MTTTPGENIKGIIGVDAGGTFTDLVFLNGEDRQVVAKAKTPTFHDDLVLTIENGLNDLLQFVNPRNVTSFNLATTLATNAIVEYKLRRTALILIGYNEKVVKQNVSSGAFISNDVFNIKGGHNQRGEEAEPFDETAFVKAIESIPANVEAIAVSSYFSVRNTSHEIKAVEIINKLRPNLYVSCGHELTTDLDAIKRATTTELNAGLIPIIMELIDSVERVCKARGMNVPITIVRGDGSIVGAPWAKEHPVEMILSGPAGSACGAYHLAKGHDLDNENNSWIVDIGGTTTDIIRLDAGGHPVLTEEGATVAKFKTLVKAIDIQTFGLGGDTRILYADDGSLSLGNRRVIPLCSLAEASAGVTEELREMIRCGYKGEPLFLIAGMGEPEDEFEASILNALKDGPRSRFNLLRNHRALWVKQRRLENMGERDVVQFASFTPTDALHVLGELDIWNRKASVTAANILASRGENALSVAKWVKSAAEKKIAKFVLKKSFRMDGQEIISDGAVDQLIDTALEHDSEVSKKIKFFLGGTLIGAGAPTWAFIHNVGGKLNTDIRLPKDSDVAGAVGAAVGAFNLMYLVKVIPLKEQDLYRVHYPTGIKDFEELDDAIDFAERFMNPWLTNRALKAGAIKPNVTMKRFDKTVAVDKLHKEIYLSTELNFEVKESQTNKI